MALVHHGQGAQHTEGIREAEGLPLAEVTGRGLAQRARRARVMKERGGDDRAMTLPKPQPDKAWTNRYRWLG